MKDEAPVVALADGPAASSAGPGAAPDRNKPLPPQQKPRLIDLQQVAAPTSTAASTTAITTAPNIIARKPARQPVQPWTQVPGSGRQAAAPVAHEAHMQPGVQARAEPAGTGLPPRKIREQASASNTPAAINPKRKGPSPASTAARTKPPGKKADKSAKPSAAYEKWSSLVWSGKDGAALVSQLRALAKSDKSLPTRMLKFQGEQQAPVYWAVSKGKPLLAAWLTTAGNLAWKELQAVLEELFAEQLAIDAGQQSAMKSMLSTWLHSHPEARQQLIEHLDRNAASIPAGYQSVLASLALLANAVQAGPAPEPQQVRIDPTGQHLSRRFAQVAVTVMLQ